MKQENLRTSKLNSEVQFNEQYWAVSLVNTGSILAGHSAIIVEGLTTTGPGLMNTRLFYGFYDIHAAPFPKEGVNSSFQINKKGYISRVTVHEDQDYPTNANKKFKEYYACTKTIIWQPEIKTATIRLINRPPSDREKNKVIGCAEMLLINSTDHYELGFYNPKTDKYTQQVIEGDYSSLLKELKYEDEIKDAKIRESIYKSCLSLGGTTEQKCVRKMIQSIKEDQRAILEIDEKYGAGKRPDLYPAWEMIGMDSVFGSKKRGMNCANWCADKLYIAGIGDGYRKKPGCLIL